MGASPQSRKHDLQEKGLAPGLTLDLEVAVEGRTMRFVTRVEEVGEHGIAVLVPMERLQRRPLPTGARVVARFGHRGKPCQFSTRVIGHSDDGACDILALPDDIAGGDRRARFRLPLALKPDNVYRMVVRGGEETASAGTNRPLKVTILDLSEGGARISCSQPLQVGDWLGIEFTLPGEGTISTRMVVLRVERPDRSRATHHAGCQFRGISMRDQDRIARYLLRRQLEMRRRGQL
ncbi:MAG: hypothetical protein Kow0010_19310 [Dehalococcoidia bacterium]